MVPRSMASMKEMDGKLCACPALKVFATQDLTSQTQLILLIHSVSDSNMCACYNCSVSDSNMHACYICCF